MRGDLLVWRFRSRYIASSKAALPACAICGGGGDACAKPNGPVLAGMGEPDSLKAHFWLEHRQSRAVEERENPPCVFPFCF